jgi:hypothetical protein
MTDRWDEAAREAAQAIGEMVLDWNDYPHNSREEGAEDFGKVVALILPLVCSAFKAGQENMRERAAEVVVQFGARDTGKDSLAATIIGAVLPQATIGAVLPQATKTISILLRTLPIKE